MTEAIARLSEYLVVIRGHDLDSQKTSTLACLLGDETNPSILQCFEKHGWNGEMFMSPPSMSELDEILCSIGDIPRASSAKIPRELSEIFDMCDDATTFRY
jgi:hypothetical protein